MEPHGPARPAPGASLWEGLPKSRQVVWRVVGEPPLRGPLPEDDRPASDNRTDGLTIEVLGPLAVRSAGEPIPVGPAMLRHLLAVLALHPAEVVVREEIVRALWGDEPPTTYPQILHAYVSQLRRQLRPASFVDGRPADVIRRVAGGYQLELDADAVDLTRFNRLVTTARSALDEGATETAINAYERALRCWRGPVLAEQRSRFADQPVVAAANQRRVDAAVEYASACHQTDQPRRAIAALLTVAEAVPLHEGLHAQLMRLHTAAGDRAAAVATYHQVCQRLADELGVDPGTQLRSAYAELLDDSPTRRPGEDASATPGNPFKTTSRPRPEHLSPVVLDEITGPPRPAPAGSAPPPDTSRPVAGPAPARRGRRGRLVALVSGCLALVLLAAAGWHLWRITRRDDQPGPGANAAATAPHRAGALREVEHFTEPGVLESRWSAYDGDRANGSWWSSDAVAIADGELRITGTGRNPTGADNRAGGACWCNKNGLIRSTGIWQAAARFDAGTGYGMIIGLYSATDAAEYLTLARLDEGTRTRMYPVVKAGGSKEFDGPVVEGTFTEWNVYGVEWRPGFVTFSLNGEVIFDTRRLGRNAPRVPTAPMYLYFSVVPGPDGPVPAPTKDTPDRVAAHVDWVRYTG